MIAMDLKKRLEIYITKGANPGDCWLWGGYIDPRGIARLYFQGSSNNASRVSWTVYRGEIPHGKEVLRTCKNRTCSNPDHLFLGTHKDSCGGRPKKKTPLIPQPQELAGIDYM